MKVSSKLSWFFTAIASVLMLNATVSYAAGKGMDVPKIGSMVVMSGLENPWDMAFTADGSMFYTEKCKGL